MVCAAHTHTVLLLSVAASHEEERLRELVTLALSPAGQGAWLPTHTHCSSLDYIMFSHCCGVGSSLIVVLSIDYYLARSGTRHGACAPFLTPPQAAAVATP